MGIVSDLMLEDVNDSANIKRHGNDEPKLKISLWILALQCRFLLKDIFGVLPKLRHIFYT